MANKRTIDDREALSHAEEQLCELLVRYDESLGASENGVAAADIDVPDDLADNLRECQAVLTLLRQCQTPRPSAVARDTPEPPAAAYPDQTYPRQLGRFHLQRVLGRGGLATVFLAYDPQLERTVALKVPLRETWRSADLRMRFLREAEAAARLCNPGVVAIYEAGEADSLCYIAQEYCEGPTLASWLAARREPVGIRRAAGLIAALAETVQHAHSRGVLHRDIKPTNVLLERRPGAAADTDSLGNMRPKLSDFGMAKLLECSDEETQAGTIIGTPEYMSPEQAQGRTRDLDATTDVYALGVILYQLLTGSSPFRGATPAETLRRVVFEEPVAPHRLRRDTPSDLEAICLKCLAKLPEERYATAHGLATDLAQFLAGKPTLARPLSTWQRTTRWARRHPAIAALAAALVFMGGALLGVVLAYNRELRGSYQQEAAARQELQRQVDVNRRAIWAADLAKAWDGLQKNRGDAMRQFFAAYTAPSDKPLMNTFAAKLLRRRFDGGDHVIHRHSGAVYAAEYSPDGRQIASAGADGMIYVQDSAGREVAQIPRNGRAHDDEINCLVYSPNGAFLASGGDDGLLRVWNSATGALVKEIGDAGTVLALGYSPDGATLAAGYRGGAVRLFYAADLRECEVSPLQHPADVGDLYFSADGSLLATVCKDRRLRVWNTPEGTLLRDWHPGVPSEAGAVAFAHRGQLLVSVDLQRSSVRFWDPVRNRQIDNLEFGNTWIHSVAFSHDDRWLAFSNKDGAIGLLDLLRLEFKPTTFTDAGCLWSVRFSPDDGQLLLAGGDGTIRLVSFQRLIDDQNEQRFDTAVTQLGFQAGTDRMAVLLGDGRLQAWSLAAAGPVHQANARAVLPPIALLAFAPDAPRAAYGEREPERGVIIDTASALERKTLQGFSTEIMSLGYAPDGGRIVTGHAGGELNVWETSTGRLLGSAQTGQQSIYAVGFTADGHRIATAGYNRLRLWDASTLRPAADTIVLVQEAYRLAFHPKGEMIASNDYDDLLLWTPETGELRRLPGHAGEIYAMAFSPDGQVLATGDARGTLLVWDVASERIVAALATGVGMVPSIAFSPDGNALAAALVSQDGLARVKIWNVGTADDGSVDFKLATDPLHTGCPPSAGAPRLADEKRTTTIAYSSDFDALDELAPGVSANYSGGKACRAQGFAGRGGPDYRISGQMRHCANDETFRLELTGLPPHDRLELNFLLAVIDSWDGAREPGIGPDLFEVRVDGLPVFRECLSNQPTRGQLYVPRADVLVVPPWRENLGFGRFHDSLYNMRHEGAFGQIPHSAATAIVEWRAIRPALEGNTAESWAIDNLEVLVQSITGNDAEKRP